MAMTKTVLIVEDDKLTREGLATMLRIANHSVIEAEDGEQALEVLASKVPDLIITDIHMPNMDGLAMVERIRADPGLSALPVIILTNDDTTMTVNRALASGVTVYLSKANLAPEALSQQILIALGE
jgi:two-component system chemotaxis response regulator CheY